MIQLVWLRGWSSLLCVVIVGVQVVVVIAGYPVAVDVVVEGSSNCQTTCQCYTDDERQRQLRESTTTPNNIVMRQGVTRDLYRNEPHVTCTCQSKCSPTTTHSSAQKILPNDSFEARSYTHHGYTSYNPMYHDNVDDSHQYDDNNDDYSHTSEPNYPQVNDDYSYVDPNYPQANDDYSYVDPNHQQANDDYAYDDYADGDHNYYMDDYGSECCKYEEVCHYVDGGGGGGYGYNTYGKRGQTKCRKVCVVPCNIPAPRPAPVDDPVTRPVPVPQPIRDDPVIRPVPVPLPTGDDPVSRPVPVPQPIADDPVFRPAFRQ